MKKQNKSKTTETSNTNDIIIEQKKQVDEQINVTNKSKHYDVRGKRSERYGLLMDKQLSNDLKNLSKAMGNNSINDFIITILIDYIDNTDNQEKLKAYQDLLKL